MAAKVRSALWRVSTRLCIAIRAPQLARMQFWSRVRPGAPSTGGGGAMRSAVRSRNSVAAGGETSMNAIHPHVEAGLPPRTTIHIVPIMLHEICIALHKVMRAQSDTLCAKRWEFRRLASIRYRPLVSRYVDKTSPRLSAAGLVACLSLLSTLRLLVLQRVGFGEVDQVDHVLQFA